MMQAPITVLQANTKRDTGKKAQVGNIMAAKVRVHVVKRLKTTKNKENSTPLPPAAPPAP
jgi:hypothetical protein